MSSDHNDVIAYDAAQKIARTIYSLTEKAIGKMGHPIEIGIFSNLALYHLLGSIDASDYSNEKGRHSVSMSLLRQCSEAIALIDLSLQNSNKGRDLLRDWHKGSLTQGKLRAELEQLAWPEYGVGLFDEPWNLYFSRFVKATQPLTHYSPQLAQWQLSIIESSASFSEGKYNFVAKAGVDAFDPVKSIRIKIFQSISIWTLGKILEYTNNIARNEDFIRSLEDLRLYIENSEYLSNKGNWEDEFAPHLIFLPKKGV